MPKPIIDLNPENKELRSFGRVQGRKLREQQQWFIDNLLDKFAVSLDDASNLQNIAQDNNFSKLCIEVGFGKGEHLAGVAKTNPDTLFVGCEPFINGVARLLKYMHEDHIENIRILHGDARLFLNNLNDSVIDKIFILFPDPWPKERHKKKRIINENMLGEVNRVLKNEAILEIATDHVDYGECIQQYLEENKSLDKLRVSNIPPEDWVRTQYQEKAERQGRGAKFFKYKNSKS